MKQESAYLSDRLPIWLDYPLFFSRSRYSHSFEAVQSPIRLAIDRLFSYGVFRRIFSSTFRGLFGHDGLPLELFCLRGCPIHYSLCYFWTTLLPNSTDRPVSGILPLDSTQSKWWPFPSSRASQYRLRPFWLPSWVVQRFWRLSSEDTEIRWDNFRLCGYYCARLYPNSGRGAGKYILLHRSLRI